VDGVTAELSIGLRPTAEQWDEEGSEWRKQYHHRGTEIMIEKKNERSIRIGLSLKRIHPLAVSFVYSAYSLCLCVSVVKCIRSERE
jgi:hypothetical protein